MQCFRILRHKVIAYFTSFRSELHPQFKLNQTNIVIGKLDQFCLSKSAIRQCCVIKDRAAGTY